MMFIQYFMLGSWLVTVGTYLSKGLKFDDVIGTAFGMQGIAAIVSSLVVGAIADRFFSAQKVMGVLAIMAGAMLLLVAQIDQSRNLFLLTLLAHYLCFVPTVPLATAIALNSMTDRSRQFPTVRVVGTAGWITAGIVVGSIPGAAETRLPLLIGGCSGLLLGLYSFTLPATPPRARGQRVSIAGLLGLDVVLKVRDRDFWVFIAGVLLLVIPLAFYLAYCNNFLVEAGAHANLFGHSFEPAAIQTLGQFSELLFLLTLPLALVRFGIKGVLLIGMITWTIRYSLFAFGFDGHSANTPMLITAVLLHGVSYDFFFVASQIYIDERFDAAARARAQAFLVTVNMGVGILLGSNLANAIYGYGTISVTEHDWRTIWLIPAGIALVGAVFLLFCFRPRAGSSRAASP